MAKIIIDIPDKTLEYASKGKDLSEEQVEDIQTAISDSIIILNNVTNGEVIKGMFPNENIKLGYGFYYLRDDIRFSFDWWNAPYKGGE